MKSCELCKSSAKIYCESDQASLCWTCDSKVHSANFLVARHSRSLLCRLCQSPTAWTAAGEKLGPSAVSVCEDCVREEGNDANENENENQVVPLSYTAPPAASASSSSCGGCSVGDSGLVKRKRENVVADFGSEDDVDCLSVKKNKGIEGNGRTTLYHFLPLSSEAMGEKLNKSEPIVGASKRTRAVGLDLNSSN